MVKMFARAAFTAAALTFATSAWAADLRMAVSAEVTSIDPHYHNLSPNNAMGFHIFDRLIHQGPKQELMPGLATSWKSVGEAVWEFTLRKNVKFHDGSPFTADDVAFTIERAGNVPNSPSSFGIYTKQVTRVEKVDDHTVRLHTAAPYPLMPNDMSALAIVSRKNGSGATTQDYNSGKAAVGTGPYKFSEYVPGDRVVLVKNENYWGDKPIWDKVTFKPISSGPARVAALKAGDVDLIEDVPTSDAAQLKKDPNLRVVSAVSNRIIYLHMDSDRAEAPGVTGKDGKPIPNPLRDARVRKALSKAINREAIVSRVMEGEAIVASQFLPEGFFGVSPNLKPEKYDPDGAKKLLAEAGLPNGFSVTIYGPNNRYINDAQIVQTIAQMFNRIGIDAKVDTMPQSVFFARATKLEFGVLLVGWGSGTGEASSPLKSFIATNNRETGMGPSNRGRYSNKKVDALIEEALRTVEDKKREKLLQEATEVAINDTAIIPLHYEVTLWATKKNLSYEGRADQSTLAMGVKPAT